MKHLFSDSNEVDDVSAGARRGAQVGLVGWLAVAALLAAFAQTVAIGLAPSLPGLTYIDDAVVVLLILGAITRIYNAPLLPVYAISAWIGLLLCGVLLSTVSLSDTFVVFRQVALPALLMLCGLVLHSTEWRVLTRVAIWIGLINAAYMVLEIFGIRLLDPVNLATYGRDHLRIVDGLPSYYNYYGLEFLHGTSDPWTRLGGTVLNPPVAGLVTATAFVFLWYTKNFMLRIPLLALLGVVTLLTVSRGGILIVVAAIAIPLVVGRFGRLGAIGMLAPVAAGAGILLAQQGNSVSHFSGLVDGLRFAVSSPVGAGFGNSGNYLKAAGITESSESLLGIAFSAGGLGTIVILFALLWRLLSTATVSNWVAAAGIGVLCAALFSESAGALNGSIPLWLAAGVALNVASRRTETSV